MYRYGFKQKDISFFSAQRGLSARLVKEISSHKKEPQWMLEFRLRAYDVFKKKKMPSWGPDLRSIDFQKFTYYKDPSKNKYSSWEKVPKEIKYTFDRLGIPEAERNFFAGVGAQYDSEIVYHNLKDKWEKDGVIFCDTDTGLKKYPEFFKKYFGTVIPPNDNKFAALNSCVWSGGSFIYIPKNVKVAVPLQAYFRINARSFGQFERTLIIAEEGSEVTYLEGCTAPIYSEDSLHAAVVEIIAKPRAKVKYITVQNWSNNIYNLVTKRAFAYRDAEVMWIDGNIGSKITMKYPSVYLMEEGARGILYSLALAGKGQIQDTGGKMFHLAPNTSSQIISKSLSMNGGKAIFRGLVKVRKGARGTKSKTRCDGMILDSISKSDAIPSLVVDENEAQLAHEATVSQLDEQQIFYLRSRGFDEQTAKNILINGFFDSIIKELPIDYAVEFNNLIGIELENKNI
ncbi:MAG: Fe-S cluster assembly protein SufB [Parcubacteria group bacterium]|nr:Fe-S cluster assembly protein SufB [Parcubacteria group bacterium]